MQHEKLGHNDDMKHIMRFLSVRMAGPSDEDGGDTGTGTITRTRTKTKKPSMYKVLLLNDDYTPMEFVVYVLQRFFFQECRRCNQNHVACASEWCGHMRCFYVRGG